MTIPREKILVTGGAGFIASHLCEALLAEGAELVVLDDFNDFYNPAIKEGNVAGFRDKVTLVRGDLRDAGLIDSLFAENQFSQVFHFAARAGVRPSIANSRLYVSTNIDGTVNLLEACRRTGVKSFIFASSSSVYGVNKKVPFAETDLIQRTISPYAATKIAGEQLCSNYSYLYGIRCICLRFFTVYGPRQRPDLAISKFTRQILADQPIDQYGDGSTARDYTFVEDIIHGVMAAKNYTESDFEIINLGGSAANTLSQLIAGIEEILGRKAKINLLPDQPGDVPLTFADVSKAKQFLGYSPQTPLKQGLQKYVEWVKQTQHFQ
ncbi:MAG: NAD-dependent epimerase/dehydratase family protein [Akkermansiaceae bacterium]|nr:NAD-dependent epimerase/dehydratase family protein [Akkermansiaceae bacterium]